MSCWPACSDWCDCINDKCQPTPVKINAIRLRTPDGRYLQASNGGGGRLVAANVPPFQWETFLFIPLSGFPFRSGDPVSLNVCNMNWGSAGENIPSTTSKFYPYLVRVELIRITNPRQSKKGERLDGWEVGGPGTRINVMGISPYPVSYPAEWTFDIVKISGGSAAAPGTPINDGDQVSLRINSNRGSTFYFRVTGNQSGDQLNGDGVTINQPGTVFTVEFKEVRNRLGTRPSVVKCQSCAVVTVKVTHSGTNAPINNAYVEALNIPEFPPLPNQPPPPNHPFNGTTGNDGRVILLDSAGRNCIPQNNNLQVQASANRHKTKTVNVIVPDSGNIEVPIQLECTQVSGRVIDQVGNAIPGVPVFLFDSNGAPLTDENGNPYQTTTGIDGSFVFNCVAHEYVQVWTSEDPQQTNITRVITPEGWTNITIIVQKSCGNLVGRVTDAETGQPIAGATVTMPGENPVTTDANGNFAFNCIKPAGAKTVVVTASGYGFGVGSGTAPVAGNSNPVNIQLRRIRPMQIRVRLDWGNQPADLDLHMSGPDNLGGRFRIFFRAMQPVPYASLDIDDTTALGPETITIQPIAAGFVAGDYHVWVHNFDTTTFTDSGAAIAVVLVDAQGNLSQSGLFNMNNANGNLQDDIWHVVNFTIDVNGNITLNTIQLLLQGDVNTIL